MLKRVATSSPRLRRPSARAGLELAWEPLDKVIEEALPTLRRHYEELGLPEPFDPDWRSLFWMAAQKRQRVVIVRDNGRIVGYCAGLWSNYLASKNAKVIMVNAFYLDPLYRGTLWLPKAMLQMQIDFAKEVGARCLEMAAQGVHRHRINRMLKYFGWNRSSDPAYRLKV